MKKLLTPLLLAAMVLPYAAAENPIISERFTPDPAPFVHNDTLYLFVDHDEKEDIGYFNMKDWLLYSTTDMVNWTYRGTPVTTATFGKWAKQDNDAWASQCIECNGKWYWYCTATVDGKGYPGIGVAVADNPAGPYVDPIGKPVAQGWFYIDPTVFIDNDGKAYLFWGNNGLWYGRLSRNMTAVTSIKEVNTKDEAAFGPYKGYDDNGNPKTNFEEAPWIYRYGDTYILEYAAGGVPEHWAYSTAPSVDGPWTYQGKVMGEPEGSFTIHGGSVDYKGHSYMFYHDGLLPGGGGFRRSTSIEEFTRGEDGSLPFIPFTKEGVAQIEYLNPYQWVEAETVNESKGVLCVGDCVTNYVTNILNANYFKVKGVDFGEGSGTKFKARVSSVQEATMIVRLNGRRGTELARVNITPTGGLDQWAEVEVDLTNVPTGVHDVYFVFLGDPVGETLFNFDRWMVCSEASVAKVENDTTTERLYNIDGTPHNPADTHPRIVVSKGRKQIKR